MEELLCDYLNRLEDKHWWFQGRKKIVLRLLDKYFRKTSGSCVLDIGCGTGMILKSFSCYGETLGMDKDLEAISHARLKNPDAKFVLGSFPEESPQTQFDLITVLDLLEHLERDETALIAAAKILKPGGIIIITVPAFGFLWSQHDDLNQHKRRYRLNELKEKIQNAGLSIQKISYYNTFLFLPIVGKKVFDRFFLRRWRPSPKMGIPELPWLLNIVLEKVFSWERYWLTKMDFPVGVSIVAVAKK